jgi:hypothetical protein
MEDLRSYSNVAGSNTVTPADTGSLDRAIRRPLTIQVYLPDALVAKYPKMLRTQVVKSVMATVRASTYVQCIQINGSIAWITLASSYHRDGFLNRGAGD